MGAVTRGGCFAFVASVLSARLVSAEPRVDSAQPQTDSAQPQTDSAQPQTDSAQPRAEQYSLTWTRGEGAQACPSAREVAADVSGRLGRDPFSYVAERSLEAIVSRVDGQWTLELNVRDELGQIIGSRVLTSRADDCSVITQAAELALALAIDPEFASKQVAPARPEPPPEPVARPAPTPLPPARPEVEPRAKRALPPRATRQYEFGIRGLVAGGLLPKTGVGVEVYASARGERLGLSLGMFWLGSQHTRQPDGDVSVSVTQVHAGLLLSLLENEFALWDGGVNLGGAVYKAAVVEPLVPTRAEDDFSATLSAESRVGLRVVSPVWLHVGVRGYMPILPGAEFSVAGRRNPEFSTPTVGWITYSGVSARFE